MPGAIKIRFCTGLAYLAIAFGVISQSPVAGFVLLVLPILWTVIVIWIGSESGVNFGPYRQARETAFSYTLRFVWQSSTVTRSLLAMVGAGFVIGGLAWISTEDLRAEASKPTLSERVVTVTETATDATSSKLKGWVSRAKSWFSSDE
ncbi:MAG: hypothetical protein AAGA06_10370 [Pseudomonadota bacterium]